MTVIIISFFRAFVFFFFFYTHVGTYIFIVCARDKKFVKKRIEEKPYCTYKNEPIQRNEFFVVK